MDTPGGNAERTTPAPWGSHRLISVIAVLALLFVGFLAGFAWKDFNGETGSYQIKTAGKHTASGSQDGRIDPNTASKTEWMDMPGIGPVIADRIIEFTANGGRFTKAEDLLQIEGIGEKTLEKFRDYLWFEGGTGL